MTVACFSAAATTGESRGAGGLSAACWPRWKAAEGDSSATRRLARSILCVRLVRATQLRRVCLRNDFVSCAPVEKPPDTVPRLTGLPLQGRTYNTSASRQCFLSSPQPNRTVEKRSPTTPFRGVVGRRPARRKRIRISGATQQGVE